MIERRPSYPLAAVELGDPTAGYLEDHVAVVEGPDDVIPHADVPHKRSVL